MCMARRKNVYGPLKDLPVFKGKYRTFYAKQQGAIAPYKKFFLYFKY